MAGAPAAQSAGGPGSPTGNSADGQKDGGAEGAVQAQPEPEERKPTERAPLGQPPAAAAGPDDRQHVAGPAPVSSPPSSHGVDRDVTRNL